jgi:alkyl sulfatase BDS1-like metallo-beta-lactamase superfamily hydrolase
MPRKTLEKLALDPSAPAMDAVISGDTSVFEKFFGMLDLFDPGFNIVLP